MTIARSNEYNNLEANKALRKAVQALSKSIENEITRLNDTKTLWKIWLTSIGVDDKTINVVNKNSNSQLQGDSKATPTKKILGKLTLLQIERNALDKLLQAIDSDTADSQVSIHLNEFLQLRLKSASRIYHHKRLSRLDQLRNKGTFIGLPSLLAAYFFDWSWVAASISAAAGLILNFTSLGKRFGGQATSMSVWETLSKDSAFITPPSNTHRDAVVMQQTIYQAMQATLPSWYYQGSGKKGRTTYPTFLLPDPSAGVGNRQSLLTRNSDDPDNGSPRLSSTSRIPRVYSFQRPKKILTNYEDQREFGLELLQPSSPRA